jgi:microcystin-dependent protein
MDRIDFKQQGGFPLVQDTLDYLQNAYGNALSGLAKVLGDKVILWGCEKTPLGVVQEGMVSLGGELLYTAGGADGTGTATVFVEETVFKEVMFEDGVSKGVYKKRTLVFGVGTPQWNWAEFRRLETVEHIQNLIFPVGGIIMWSGAIADIPAGWALCDGTQGTPNLKGRFIVGYDAGSPTTPANITAGTPNMPPLGLGKRPSNYGKIGNTGVGDGAYLTGANVPAHFHYTVSNSGVSGGGDNNPLTESTAITRVRETSGNLSYRLGGANDEANIGRTSVYGIGTNFENRPPYYVLAYIMKISNN